MKEILVDIGAIILFLIMAIAWILYLPIYFLSEWIEGKRHG